MDGECVFASAYSVLQSPKFSLQGRNSNPGVTNIRNAASSHLRRWLGIVKLCLVSFASFPEPELQPGGTKLPAWFARDWSRPMAFIAVGFVRPWKSVREVKEGETTNGPS